MRVGRRLALFMLAAGIAGASFALVMRHSKQSSPDLLAEGAVPVLSFAPSIDPYTLWLNNHILFLSRSGDNIRTHFFTRDIYASREAQLQGLDRLNVPSNSVQASPDGTLLLWQDRGEPSLSGGEKEEITGNFATIVGQDGQRSEAFDIRTATHVVSLQNSPAIMHTWKQQQPPYALLWLNDSRHFVELNADRSAILVHDCLQPSVIQTLKPKQAHDLDAISGVVQMTQGDELVCTPAFHGLEPVVPQADILVLPIMQNTGRGMALGNLQHYTVKFPPHAHIWDSYNYVAFSPCGDKIAWWLKFDNDATLSITAPLVHFLYGVEPDDRRQRANNLEQAPLWLWECNTDGTNMHSIGKIDVHFNPKASYDNNADNLQWLPDDSHLSFHYHNSLWVVPTE